MEKVPLLKIVLSSAGVIGVLVGIGYLVEAARESLLGISLVSGRSTAEYAAVGGTFFVDLLSLIWTENVLSAICLGGVLLIAVIVGIIRIPTKYAIRVRLFLLILLLASFAAKSVWLDLPYISMTNLLTKPPLQEPAAESSTKERRQHDIWQRFICARGDLTTRDRLPDCNDQDERGCFLRASNKKTPSRPGSVEDAVHSCLTISQEFVLNVFATSVLAYLALLLISMDLALQSAIAAAMLRIVLAIVIVVNVLALPFIYGKVIRSTRFPSGDLVYESADPQLKPAVLTVPSLLISSDNNLITVYDLKDHAFLQVLRSHVKSIGARDSEDLVAKRINFFLPPPKEDPDEDETTPGVAQ